MLLDTVYTSSYVDTAIAAARTYAYRIQAFGSSNASSPFSNSDVATTTSLPQVNAGDTIAAADVSRMLVPVNLVRAAAGWPAVTWANIVGPGHPLPEPDALIYAQYFYACRSRMNEALQALGAVARTYTDTDLVGLDLEDDHINELLEAAQ